MKTWGFLLQSVLLSLSLSGCGYAMEEMGLFKTGNIVLKSPVANTYSEATIDYYVVSNTALKTCLDCHKSKAPILDSEDKVYDNRDDIMAVVQAGEMPPKSKGYQALSACELKILQTYFDNKTNNHPAQRVKEIPECSGFKPAPTATPSPTATAAPTTPPGTPPLPPGPPSPPPPPPPSAPAPSPAPTTSPSPQPDLGQLELSYKNLRMAFFDTKCLSCHSASATRPKNPHMDSIASIRAATDGEGNPIVAATGAESLLYKVTIPGMTDTVMPPPRVNMQLTPAEADYLKRWIDAGMPE